MSILPSSLAVRLIFALTILVAIVAGIFGYMNVHIQKRQLLDEMVIAADQLSQSIISATWHTMLADQPEATYQIMETIGQNDVIASIRFFNKEGRVTYSTDPNAPAQVDINAEACNLCHAKEQPLVRVDMPLRWRVFSDRSGNRQLAMITPIYNEPACSNAACHAHPPERSVLGVLDIAMPLARVDREVAGVTIRAFLMSFTQIILIGLLIAIFARRFVTIPIRKLIRGTRAVSAHNLDLPLDIHAEGELGELAESFMTMREDLKEAQNEVDRITHGLEQQVEERSRQLSMAQKKLIQSDRLASLGQLAASVAHEINNPISGVLNFSTLMQRILTDEGIPEGRVKDFRKYLGSVTDETARVGRIVSDLLSFSRRSKPQRSPANLNQIVVNTISLITHKLELSSIQLDLVLGENVHEVSCDASQMQQVVINLVMNAAEAMSSGGRVGVRTRANDEADTVILEVEDTGAGIPEDILSRVFDPFFSTKDEGKGVGLGLAVVYGIVDAHGGTIEVQSAVGHGTTFTVSLPRHPLPVESQA